MEKVNIPLPTDVVVGKEFSETAEARIKSVDEVADDDMIFDIGPDSARKLAGIIASMGTIIWNGPWVFLSLINLVRAPKPSH